MNAGQRKVGQEPVGGVQVWRAELLALHGLVMPASASEPDLAAGQERGEEVRVRSRCFHNQRLNTNCQRVGGDVQAPVASRIAGRPVATTAGGRAAQTIPTSRTCGNQVIVPSSALSYVPMIRGLTSNTTMMILTCWTTGRRQPWRSHIWQVHPPSISPPDLLIRQPETGRISLKAVHPCLRLQIARAEGNLTAIRTLLLLLLELWAHQLVPVSLFPPEDGCDMQQPLIVRPALT